ncbi:MAG TPA: GNAT family N-acetyltransferase [Blastocatellia bacterium]|nr:GNAT family N-acetyltransferase [Blastocatellia bacterium]
MAVEKVTRRSVLGASASRHPQPTRPANEPRPVAGAVANKSGLSVTVVEDLTDLERHVSAWEDLAAAALEPNVFYEPWMLMPAIRAFGAGQRVRFALITAPDPARPAEAPLLAGLFPLEQQSQYQGLSQKLPFKTLSLWKHKYCYLCTPLIRAGYGREVIAAFFDWLAAGGHGCSLMEFTFIAGDGLFYNLLIDYFDRHAKLSYVTSCFMRALFRPASDAEAYMRAALHGTRRHELRRHERRLSEAGRLEYLSLEPGDEVAAWIEEFLRIEAISWKGRGGRALARDEADREYFVEVAEEAFRRGQLMMLAMRLDGRPIAHKCNFLSGPGSFAFKIAFDEKYARHSPGVLLELENIRRLHAQSKVRWMDSCADPSHPMLDRLWPDRRTIQDVVVGAGRPLGDWVVATAPLLRLLNRKLRRKLRD